MVDLLLLNPDAIPTKLQLAFGPSEVGQLLQPLSPHLPAPEPPSADSIASLVQQQIMATMAPYLAVIAELQAKDHARMETDGGEQSPPVPTASISLPATTAVNLPDARITFDHVPSTTMEAILENRFDIKDLWKLIPMRIAERASNSSQGNLLGATRAGNE